MSLTYNHPEEKTKVYFVEGSLKGEIRIIEREHSRYAHQNLFQFKKLKGSEKTLVIKDGKKEWIDIEKEEFDRKKAYLEPEVYEIKKPAVNRSFYRVAFLANNEYTHQQLANMFKVVFAHIVEEDESEPQEGLWQRVQNSNRLELPTDLSSDEIRREMDMMTSMSSFNRELGIEPIFPDIDSQRHLDHLEELREAWRTLRTLPSQLINESQPETEENSVEEESQLSADEIDFAARLYDDSETAEVRLDTSIDLDDDEPELENPF